MSKDVLMRSAKLSSLWFLMIVFVIVVFAMFSYNDPTANNSVVANQGPSGTEDQVEVWAVFEANE